MRTETGKTQEFKINLNIVRNIKDFRLLKNEWERLSGELPPFMSFNWLYSWWKSFGNEGNLLILTAEHNSSTVGIAPLYIKKSLALNFVKIRELYFLGGDLTDYSDFIIDNNVEREKIFQCFFDYITGSYEFDTIDLRRINSSSPNFDLWRKYSEKFNFRFIQSKECPFLNLSEHRSYDTYYKKLSKSLKRNLTTRSNKIIKDGYTQEVIIKNKITYDDINLIAEINKERQIFKLNQGELKRFCYFTDKTKRGFIQDFFCNDDLNNIMFAYLKMNNTVVSYILGLKDKKTVYYWNTAVNTNYLQYAPSKFLIAYLIEYAFENNLEKIDFLRGKSPYKLEWCNGSTINYNILLNKTITSKIIDFYRRIKPDFLRKKYKFEVKD